MTLFDPDPPLERRWLFGFRYSVKKGHRWSNQWLAHRCRDLALPLELGVRVFHSQPACPCRCHLVIQPGLVPCPTCGSGSEHLFDRS